jgi:dipeptidyl aminopeptidase/acylaminoacyl peptidase
MPRLLMLLMALAGCLAAQQQPPFTVHALLQLSRISEPQISPDGAWVAYVVQTIDVPNNTRPRQIWIVPSAGGPARQLTHQGTANSRPRWSADSKSITYISNASGTSQVWTMNADGTEAKAITNVSTGADTHIITPDGRNVLFTSQVYPECGADDACNKKRMDEEAESKVKARTYTTLLYRHWDQWQSKRRKHILMAPVGGGPAKDLTPGNLDVPPFSLDGEDDFAVSPASAELCFTMTSDPVPATGTNFDLYVVPLEGGETRRITDNPGADKAPQYSPDGKYLAYRSQARGGFESDRWRLMLLERESGVLKEITQDMDRPVTHFFWAPDSRRLFFTVEDRGRQVLQMMSVDGGGARTIIGGKGNVEDATLSADGKTMVYTESSGVRPSEIFRASSAGGAPLPLTNANRDILSAYHLSSYEDFWVTGADQARVHSFVVKPYGFDEKKKYPVLLLIHGGPQGAWRENWGYRWNPQVFASAGYVVVMPNPRGSTGYGQKFTDEISGDWGGRVYDDLMAVMDHVERLPYVDATRMAAAGGSYGGYMVNWILGRTNRFKALVSHAGVYDLPSMFGVTEELWFPLWEFQGTPWDNPEMYERFSPSRYVKDFQTPTLVIHGELDFRVPYDQGLNLFTALQMQKVPSKLLIFPDEGHWINKPQNSVLWYETFLDWVGEWTRKKGN